MFGFFFIALGLPERASRYGKKDNPSPSEPNNMSKQEMPPADNRGFFPKLIHCVFGGQGDEAALKEEEESDKRAVTLKELKKTLGYEYGEVRGILELGVSKMRLPLRRNFAPATRFSRSLAY